MGFLYRNIGVFSSYIGNIGNIGGSTHPGIDTHCNTTASTVQCTHYAAIVMFIMLHDRVKDTGAISRLVTRRVEQCYCDSTERNMICET